MFAFIFAFLVALQFFYIMFLETFATTSETTARIFGMSQEELEQKSVNTLFKNQGVYNGLIAVLVLMAIFTHDNFWLANFMIYIVLVAAYGAFTSDLKIFFKQGGLALLTLLSLFF